MLKKCHNNQNKQKPTQVFITTPDLFAFVVSSMMSVCVCQADVHCLANHIGGREILNLKVKVAKHPNFQFRFHPSTINFRKLLSTMAPSKLIFI